LQRIKIYNKINLTNELSVGARFHPCPKRKRKEKK